MEATSVLRTLSSGASNECPENTVSEFPSTRNFPVEHFSDRKLSTSLGVITYLTDCGLGEFDSIPNVLYNLRLAIVTLLHQCIYIDKELYADYIQAFLRKTQLLVGKLITPALKMCHLHVLTETCRQVIRESYALILLVYLFANPLKISKILTDNYGLPNPHGINITSLETNLLLETARELQIELVSYSARLARQKRKAEDANNTARNVCVGLVHSALELVSLLIVTVITNSVPTSVVFLYFKELLTLPSFSLLDFEYFEEFLNHFAAVNDLAIKKLKPALFECQKLMIQPHFLEVITAFNSHCFSWCTKAQMLDYLQVLIDIYNEVYSTELTLATVCDLKEAENHPDECTVIKNRELSGPLDPGHYKNYYEGMTQEQTSVPDFVHYFERSPESFIGLSDNLNLPVDLSLTTSYFKNVKETDIKQQRFEISRSTYSGLLASSICNQVTLLNEAVAREVRGLRSKFEEKHVEVKVALDQPQIKCFKCRYIPWHRHHN